MGIGAVYSALVKIIIILEDLTVVGQISDPHE